MLADSALQPLDLGILVFMFERDPMTRSCTFEKNIYTANQYLNQSKGCPTFLSPHGDLQGQITHELKCKDCSKCIMTETDQ